jgi:hypothetical protein
MSRQKPDGPKKNPRPDPHDSDPKEKSTNRHVYIEPGVQIDLVQDLRNDIKTAQTNGTADNRKQLFWTKVSAGLLLLYVGLTLWQAYSAQNSVNAIKDQFERDQRPYIAITKFEIFDSATSKPRDPQDFEIGKPLTVNVDFKNIGKTPAVNIVPHYHVLFGKDVERIKIEAADNSEQGGMLDPGTQNIVTAVSLMLAEEHTAAPLWFSTFPETGVWPLNSATCPLTTCAPGRSHSPNATAKIQQRSFRTPPAFCVATHPGWQRLQSLVAQRAVPPGLLCGGESQKARGPKSGSKKVWRR